MSEIHDLAAEDQVVLMGEMTKAALVVKVRLDAPPSLLTGPTARVCLGFRVLVDSTAWACSQVKVDG